MTFLGWSSARISEVILIPVTTATNLTLKIIGHDREVANHACHLCHNYLAIIELFQA